MYIYTGNPLGVDYLGTKGQGIDSHCIDLVTTKYSGQNG